jgi:hypothetical protein
MQRVYQMLVEREKEREREQTKEDDCTREYR